ncbi:probable monooxygenase af470 [Coccomyxa sp. Obi]|nr:probable monooxygenase af470 [Coccomyxa sp. Obi]
MYNQLDCIKDVPLPRSSVGTFSAATAAHLRCSPRLQGAMDIAFAAYGAAVIFLLLPLIVLAFLGILYIRNLTTYNHPMLPNGSPGLAQRGQLIKESSTAHIKGDFVVFHIGLSVHNWWQMRTWLPAVQAMPAMLKELKENPECGFLGGHAYLGNPTLLVQYWRSFDQLMEYARAPSRQHFPAWMRIRELMRATDSFGIYHETFKVRAGEYECIYMNLHPYGLGGAMGPVPIKGRYNTARGRAGESKGDDHPENLPERPF